MNGTPLTHSLLDTIASFSSRARARCSLFAVGVPLLVAASRVQANALFLPPEATVVLMAGLPGDVQSEGSYREALQGWLEWLGTVATPPRQVFVFWDSPEVLLLPPKLPVKISPARREDFLALGKTLAGQTNGLLAILWGHGGTQGRTPVFHVRGPRITPADVKALAEQVQPAQSRWVLFFRGSGQFARELAGPDRQIISSEHEVMFTNDPIGLPLLLKVARTESSISFAAAAEELGRAVGDWYESRSLARTEEPTLWLPGAEPKRLVPSDKPGALASVKELKEAPPTTTASEKLTQAESESAELPAIWKDLARVEPQKFPDADAVVLRRRVSFRLGSSPAITSEHEQFVQILTAEGKHFGDFDVSYSPPDEELEVLDCEVLRPDGKLLRLDPDDVREGADESVADYRTSRRKFFSLPGVAPGAVLRVRYRTQWKSYPMPHVSLALPLADETPILESTLQVTVPKDSSFHFTFDQAPPADPAIKQTAEGSTYAWHFRETAALPGEALAPPQLQPAVLISTWPDWAAFAEWYGRITKLADELTPELEEKVRELTRDAQSDRDKVRAVYDYVTSLRYVAVPLGVNSLRPHAAAQVFKNQFGDCKDKANLFNTLLRALGIEAHLVLVPRFTQAHAAVPGLAFNHAIARVTLGGETLWADTTDDVCRFGMLPPGDAGRRVLVIDGKSTTLTELPSPAAKDHRLELRGEVKLNSGDGAASVEIRATAKGYPDYELRSVARAWKGHRRNVPLLSARCRLAAGALSLAKQHFTSPARLDEDFAWQAEGQLIGLSSGEAGRWLLRAPFWLPEEWDLALHPRKTPLFLNAGYPLTLDEEIEIQLPSGAEQIRLPAVKENSHGPLVWKIEWTPAGEGRVRARLRVELPRGELAGQDVGELQRQLRELLTFVGHTASFVAPP
ncbi:MAG: DUF3857 domain-containing protein [Verrucomicrobia bacterium]|nr:DUF3857 domain-containing protein [Verrucomicrobiota bacterium]